MTIRDLSQYIKALCSKETIELLGTNQEVFLQLMDGRGPSDQVQALISGAASFASNAEEQLFYEFVQNAYDANADSLFFYANDKYLIVLNNGEPFYTDFNIFYTEKPRDGQLYNFLAKGKSLKRSDATKLGKYGQGSKLLYTLLTDISDSSSNEDMLIKAIYEEKKGPYLISWYDRKQLANLLLKQNNWTLAQADDYKNHLLFAKILMSYYPIAPGVNEKLFNVKEALDAVNAFDELVDPRRNLHFLDRGTALIIPLGKGKYEKIASKDNLEKVKTRLGGFASITKDQERNAGKTVDHIYVMGEEIEQHEVKSVFVEFNNEGNNFFYHFAFNPVFAKSRFVNLFKGLPILQTRLRLGFIIDSQNFEVDDSRQRINDTDKTNRQLVRAFNELILKLKELKETDQEKFDYIYKSLIATNVPQGEDFSYIRNAFKEVMKPFFEECVLSEDGSYTHVSQARLFKDDYNIPLQELGITKYKWVDSEAFQNLKRHEVIAQEITFATVIADAEKSKLALWIKSLSNTDYSAFQKLCDSHKFEQGLSSVKLFRTNKGNLYSYDELKSNIGVYYPIEAGMQFGDCEHLVEPLSETDVNRYVINLLEKIQTNINAFRESDSSKDDACNLLAWIASKNSNLVSKIKSEIALLPNWHDDYLPFCELLSVRPNDTILFDKYCIKGYIPSALKGKSWVLDPNKLKKEAWNWICAHWEQIQINEDWGENTHQYLSDIKRVYKNAPTNEGELQKLILYLDEFGKPTGSQYSIVSNISRLSEEEYNLLVIKVPQIKFLAYEFYKELSEAPFKVPTIYISDIVGNGIRADKDFLSILVKIADDYLRLYRTQESDGVFYVTKPGGSLYNYIDSVSPSLQEELTKSGFYRIPDYVQELLNTEKVQYKFGSNETMLKKAIESISNPIMLLPIVKQSNASVIYYFFTHLKPINIDKKITSEDIRWQVIEFAVQRNDDNDYIGKVFALIRHKEKSLPSSITQQTIYVGEHAYNVYDLYSGYKDDNEAVDSFLSCLPSPNGSDFFRMHYYDGKEEAIDVSDLYDDICGTWLDIEQLRFCIDYSIQNDADYDNLEIDEDEDTIKALDMILMNRFVGFDKYFAIRDVDYEQQIYANQALLLDEEKLPKDVQAWISQHPESLDLFTRLKTDSEPLITLRKAIYENTDYSDFSFITNGDTSDDEILATLNWIKEFRCTFIFGISRFNTAMGLIEALPDDFNDLMLLRYTGQVVPAENELDRPKPTFTFEEYDENCAFFSSEVWQFTDFTKNLEKSAKLRRLFKEQTVYFYKNKDFLANHGLNKKPRWYLQNSVESTDFPEHDDVVYRKWKEMEESKGIKIYTSDRPIAMNFSIMSGQESVYTDKISDSEFGYEVDKRVIIHIPNKEGLTLMKAIAKYIVSMNFFKEPFIVLQSLYVDEWEHLQDGSGTGTSNIDLSKSSLSVEQAQDAINKMSEKTAENIESVNQLTEQMSPDSIEKLSDSAEAVKDLVDSFDKEELEMFAEKKDKLKQMMEDLAEAEEEEKESQVRQTIGFIGELIYSNYLENKKLVKDKDFIHAALEGVGEYDFEIKTDNTFVDVKTTLYSLKDGTAPFYLHRSQNVFMQKHPDSKYHIVRISLNDLNLQKSYEEVRDTYGKDANPLEDAHLRRRCEQIAKKYWKGAKIEEFDALSPEYSIRIERKEDK